MAEQGKLTDFQGKTFDELTLNPIQAEPLENGNDDPLADFAISDDDNEDEDTGDESDDTVGPPKK